MHIPPYYRQRNWQRFFIGIVLGALVAYGLFLFIHGSAYERLIEKNYDLQSKITELESQNEALLQDQKDLDEKAKTKVTVQTIAVHISNAKELRLDRLILHQLEEQLTKEFSHLVGQDIEVVDRSINLLQLAVENKQLTFDDLTYTFQIKQLTIAPTLRMNLEAKINK